MRFSLFTLGSRGDVQPYLALGRALQAAGQSVTVSAPENFGSLIQASGLGFDPLPWDIPAALNRDSLRKQLKGDNLGFFLGVQRQFATRQDAIQSAWMASARASDVLVATTLTQDNISLLGSAYSKPVLFTELAPLAPSAYYAPITSGFGDLGCLNRPLHWMFRQGFWGIGRSATAAFAKKLGLDAPLLAPALRAQNRGGRTLHAFSEALFGAPRDWGPERHHVGGAWRLEPSDAQRVPGDHQDAGFEAWLEDGPPPIYLGFGSIPALTGPELLELAGELVEILDLRVVVGAGWTGFDGTDCELPEGVALTGDCDHAWLFDRCCAVVHHGGAGTTHTAAAAGLPQVVCPFFADQPFWAARVKDAGAGLLVPSGDLRPGSLAEALAAALRDSCQEAAAALADRMRAEAGAPGAARRAVEWCGG